MTSPAARATGGARAATAGGALCERQAAAQEEESRRAHERREPEKAPGLRRTRQAIGGATGGLAPILTQHGLGYTFTASIARR